MPPAAAHDDGLPGMIGSSPAMRDVFRLTRKAADSSATVLLLGETGSGKELVAKGGINLGMQTGRTNVDIFVSASVGTWDELRVATPQTGSNTTRDGLGTYHWFGIGTSVNL